MDPFVIRVEKMNSLHTRQIEQFNTLRDEGTKWDATQGAIFLANKANALFLASIGSQIVGFLTAYRLQRLDKRRAEVLLYEVAVAPEMYRKGIGKALLHQVQKWATQEGSDEVWVLTHRSNQAGMALYTSLGGIIESTDEQMFTFKL